jgi:hypothetical protein
MQWLTSELIFISIIMGTTKQPQGKIVFQEDTADKSERELRRAELKEKYPEGYVWIQPICDYVDVTSMAAPRPEDKWKPRVTILKVPVSVNRGTHPQTGLPRYDDKLVPIHLIDPDMKWPVDVRSDLIRGLGAKVLDPWELLDFLDSYPGRESLFKLVKPDPLIDGRVQKGLKTKGAKTALRAVMNQRPGAARPSESAPTRQKAPRPSEGHSFDEGLAEGVEEEAMGAL